MSGRAPAPPPDSAATGVRAPPFRNFSPPGPGSVRQSGLSQTVREQLQILRPPEGNPILPPANTILEVTGPETFQLTDLAREVLMAFEDTRQVTADPRALYFGAEVGLEKLVAENLARGSYPLRLVERLRGAGIGR